MSHRFPMVALLTSAVAAGCFTEKPYPPFCDKECPSSWTPQCEVQCGQARPPGCTDPPCPVNGGAGTTVTDAGPITGVPDDGSPAEPCGQACPRESPVCDEERMQCVQCVADGDCAAVQAGGRCFDNRCVQCLDNTDCDTSQAPHCDETIQACVGCRADGDCQGVTDRVGAPLTVCDAEQRECVQCTGSSFAACGQNEDGERLVCNSVERRCDPERTVASTTLCNACVADAQCEAGMRCVPETFSGGDVPVELGFACLWAIQADDSAGPENCDSPQAGLFRIPQAGAESIDGDLVTVCQLAATTCRAIEDYRETECSSLGTTAECGEPDLRDSVCAARDVGGGTVPFCSFRCLSESDCFGTPCRTSEVDGSLRYCSF